MNTLKGSRQKRSSSASNKHKNNPLATHDINLFPIYAPQKKSKQNSYSIKGKGKENKQFAASICKEKFPKEVIKFKNLATTLSREAMQEPKQQTSPKQSQNVQEPMLTKNTVKKHQSPQKELKWFDGSDRKSLQGYLNKFNEALNKIFKGLDIFNRGVITETNITKWIPEEALYFLGNIFQKIRQDRLNLTLEQFKKHCVPILYESTEQDLKVFLEAIIGKGPYQAIPISFANFDKNQQSHVQLRIGNNKLQKYQKRVYNKNVIPFDQLIGNIKSKEKDIAAKISAKKEKFNEFIESTNAKERSLEKQKRVQEDLPYFNFELPMSKKYVSTAQPTLMPLSNRKQADNLDFTFKQVESAQMRPRTSRIVHQKIIKDQHNELKTERKINTGTDKIDRLSSKLEEYLKFNREKIQKNKNFLRENSAPKACF